MTGLRSGVLAFLLEMFYVHRRFKSTLEKLKKLFPFSFLTREHAKRNELVIAEGGKYANFHLLHPSASMYKCDR